MLGVFEVVGDWPTRGLMMVSQLLGYPICYGTPTGHYGPEVGAIFMNFGKTIEFRGDYMMGYNCLYLVLLSPPVCLMSFSIVISLFFEAVGQVLVKHFVCVGVL